jgi:hypothetical protein
MARLNPSERQAIAGELQGAALMEVVIERVRRNPRPIAGFCGDYPLTRPQPMPPETLASLTFPSGKPLPPSLRRWLAFDTSWLESLGWFADGRFTPRRIDEIVTAEFEPLWGEMYQPLADRLGECFLLPQGTESRRVFAVTEPDTLGEYPVIVVDVDDLPYAAVMYPGFDIYMADLSGLAIHTGDTYEDLADDPRYLARMRHHVHHLFRGKNGIEVYDAEWGGLMEDGDQLEPAPSPEMSANTPAREPDLT